MSPIAKAFARCRKQGRSALIPYFMAGYPSDSAFCTLVKSSFEAGADMIEIGIPFSDPVADGPTIQHAGQQALENGVNTDRVFELLGTLSVRADQPLIIMSYFNPILQYGLDRFLSEARKVGVRGLIVPDLVVEEGKTVETASRAAGIDLIYLLAPTSPPARQKVILKRSRGFVYAVSAMGVTGARATQSEQMLAHVAQVRRNARLPIAMGFGISSPEAAARAALVADGVIVGSILIDLMTPGLPEDDQVKRVAEMIKRMRQSVSANILTSEIVRQEP